MCGDSMPPTIFFEFYLFDFFEIFFNVFFSFFFVFLFSVLYLLTFFFQFFYYFFCFFILFYFLTFCSPLNLKTIIKKKNTAFWGLHRY